MFFIETNVLVDAISIIKKKCEFVLLLPPIHLDVPEWWWYVKESKDAQTNKHTHTHIHIYTTLETISGTSKKKEKEKLIEFQEWMSMWIMESTHTHTDDAAVYDT